jgi:hypothetical protein
MTSFKEYYYYLKTVRWIPNNPLDESGSPSSSSSTIVSNIQKEKYFVKKEIENAMILDLEKWSEYKVNRLVEERMMD